MASNIYRNNKSLKVAENKQHEIKLFLNKLRKYDPTKSKKIKAREETLSAAEKLLNNRQYIIDAFKTGIFPYKESQIKEESKEESEEQSEKESEEESEAESEELEEKMKGYFKKFIEYIDKESKDKNHDLFKEQFDFVVPSALAKKLYETKDKKKNNNLAKLIKNRWSDLKDEIEKMSKDEK